VVASLDAYSPRQRCTFRASRRLPSALAAFLALPHALLACCRRFHERRTGCSSDIPKIVDWTLFRLRGGILFALARLQRRLCLGEPLQTRAVRGDALLLLLR